MALCSVTEGVISTHLSCPPISRGCPRIPISEPLAGNSSRPGAPPCAVDACTCFIRHLRCPCGVIVGAVVRFCGSCPDLHGAAAWKVPEPIHGEMKIYLDNDDDIGDDDDMLNCQKCGHHWEPMVSNPLKCPACNQPKYWNKKVRNIDEVGERSGSKEAGNAVRKVRQPIGVGTQRGGAIDGKLSFGGNTKGKPKPDEGSSGHAKAVAHGTGKCPHGWMNWMVCHDNHGGC